MAFKNWLDTNQSSLAALSAGLLGGRNPQEQMSMAFQGLGQAAQQNKTLQWLEASDPELAGAVKNGALTAGDAFKLHYARKLEAEKPKSFQFVQLPNGDYGAWDGQNLNVMGNAARPEAAGTGASELGLNVVWGKDANGNPVAFQPSKSGGLVPASVPDGVVLSDPYNRALDSAAGKNTADRRDNLPQIEGAADTMISTIDSLASDPYLPDMVGPTASKLPNFSSASNRVQSKMDQIGGQTFLQAFNTLKGGGQITETEGAKATAAIARLNTAQSEADYRAALAELRDLVVRAKERARQQAAGPYGGTQAQPITNDPLGLRGN